MGPGKLGSIDLPEFDLIAQKWLDAADVRKTAAGGGHAGGARASHLYARSTADRAVPGDQMSQRVTNGFNVRRSPDLAIILEPYWLLTNSVSMHGRPAATDSHVPVIFMGSGIKAGRYNVPPVVNDIAPTLATILDVEIPSGSSCPRAHAKCCRRTYGIPPSLFANCTTAAAS